MVSVIQLNAAEVRHLIQLLHLCCRINTVPRVCQSVENILNVEYSIWWTTIDQRLSMKDL